jgi:hypothetical protein
MASEKQTPLINKLLSERVTEYGELQALYHAGTGKQARLSDTISDLNPSQASWVINRLLQAPKRMSPAQATAKEAAFQAGVSKYEKLIEWAKSKGVKVRARMKKDSIFQAIDKAGLFSEIPAELK